MKIDKYEGYNEEQRFKEGVITLLEKILDTLSPKEEKEDLAEVINTIEKKTKKRKINKDEVK